VRPLATYVSVLAVSIGLAIFASVTPLATPCWCWPGNFHIFSRPKVHTAGTEYASDGSYGTEVDWNNPQHIFPLNYEQAQGKRIFYQQCVWCHADSTPAGPSNRSNVSPDPPLMNDGTILNAESDASLHKIIAAGGGSVGKSVMMPPYGLSLSETEIDEVIAYMRAIAVPEFHQPSSKRILFWRKKP